MRSLGLPMLQKLTHLAPLALRAGVGAVFAVHGWQKLTDGAAGFAQMLVGLGVPAPEVFAWLVTAAELVGGVLLLLGLLTRLATLPLIATMVGAIALVKTDLGVIAPMGAPMPGAELDIALLAGLLALALLGPGSLSLDHAVGVERAEGRPLQGFGHPGTGVTLLWSNAV